MFTKVSTFLTLLFFLCCIRFYGQARTPGTALFGDLGIGDNATLAFFGPEVYFYSGVLRTAEAISAQVYFSPDSQAYSASPASYSQAPVVYTGTADFLFPVGDHSAYHPLWMTEASSGRLRAAFVAAPHPEQFNAPAPFALNPLFHWTVAGDKTAHLQLQWNVFNYNYPWTTDPVSLRLLGFTGTQWEEIPTNVIQNTENNAQNNSAAYRLKTRNKIDFTAYTALSLANDFSGGAVEVSEALTPNGDGINDTWYIANIAQFPQAHIRVFNRWGNPVFNQKTPYQNDWGGTHKNHPLPSGPYFYQIDLDQDGEIEQQGWIYIK